MIVYVNPDIVKEHLKAFDVKKFDWSDNINSFLLKELADVIALSILTIFNYEYSLSKGEVPDNWKEAKITPIVRQDKTNSKNYKPINLTCILSKVIKKIVRDNIISNLKNNEYLSKKQWDFISGKSTALQLLSALKN